MKTEKSRIPPDKNPAKESFSRYHPGTKAEKWILAEDPSGNPSVSPRSISRKGRISGNSHIPRKSTHARDKKGSYKYRVPQVHYPCRHGNLLIFVQLWSEVSQRNHRNSGRRKFYPPRANLRHKEKGVFHQEEKSE